MNSIAPSNRLADSLSPYLRLHADNPVNWQPWDDEALDLARAKDAPILLSIGYSACHWCHVMEEESFSNDEIAGMMNEGFICIKVDREERPDLDKTYQLAHFLLSRTTGGWPLTVFLSPEQVPFFTGTYFPPRARRGQLSLPDVLERVRAAWATKRDEIQQQNEVIAKAIVEIDSQAKGNRLPGTDVARKCASQLASSFDLEHGGLGKAPKFPQVPSLKFAVSAFARGRTVPSRWNGGHHGSHGKWRTSRPCRRRFFPLLR